MPGKAAPGNKLSEKGDFGLRKHYCRLVDLDTDGRLGAVVVQY